jgi:signal transduction histidine kinase
LAVVGGERDSPVAPVAEREGDVWAGRERFTVMGEIAAEIAHELRNLLQVIAASAYLARQEIGKNGAAPGAAPDPSLRSGVPAPGLPHVLKIEKSARLAHAIVDDLMALARGDSLHFEPVLLAEVIVAARADIPPEAAAWADAVEPHDLRMRAHAGLAARLLHVLYDNAIQASAPRTPSIRTRAWTDGPRVVVEVADDGPGVPKDIAARVFDPLVTARPGGTGLGLALARRIAAAHGGAIALVDAPAGATFRLEIPA